MKLVDAQADNQKGPGEGLAEPAHLLIGERERVPGGRGYIIHVICRM